MMWWVLGGAVVASVVVPLAVGGLHTLANRERASTVDAPEAVPVRHTEEERAEAWVYVRGDPWQVAARCALQRQEIYTGIVLDGMERELHQRLDAVWVDTCAALGLDEVDVEWALLSAGELVTS